MACASSVGASSLYSAWSFAAERARAFVYGACLATWRRCSAKWMRRIPIASVKLWQARELTVAFLPGLSRRQPTITHERGAGRGTPYRLAVVPVEVANACDG